MPMLFIHLVNSEFRSRDDGAPYDRPEDALALGIQSAIAIAADEIQRGERSAAVEICIEEEGVAPVLRSIVAVSVSPLMTDR